MRRCHKCGKEWMSDKKVPAVKEFCEACSAYLHCCLNCRFHDRNLHNQCGIPTTDWVGGREGCNFCDEFEFANAPEGGGRAENAKQEARDAFSGLFDEEPEPKGPADFDSLFDE